MSIRGSKILAQRAFRTSGQTLLVLFALLAPLHAAGAIKETGKGTESPTKKDSSHKDGGKKRWFGDDEPKCKHRKSGRCGDDLEKVKNSHKKVDGYRAEHGHKAGSFGKAGASACGAGQGSCASNTGGGYRGLASALTGAVRSLNNDAAEMRKAQRAIVEESLSESPGRSHPEAARFEQSTDGGKSRHSDFEASNPEVKEQVEHYNALGDAIDETEAEAKRYDAQAAEMNKMAEKSEGNAKNLEAQNKAAGSGQPLGKGEDESQSTVQGRSEKGLESTGTADMAKADDALKGRDSGGEKAGGTVAKGQRNGLRERLRDSLDGAKDDKENGAAGSSREASLLAGKGDADQKKKGSAVGAAEAEDSIPAFGKSLNGTGISLAGSETEASVKAMLRDFGADALRAPASTLSSEIGAENGLSLFERCRATHRRCEKNGCVGSVERKGAGG